MRTKKKFLSMVLALAMVLTLFPVTALADEANYVTVNGGTEKYETLNAALAAAPADAAELTYTINGTVKHDGFKDSQYPDLSKGAEKVTIQAGTAGAVLELTGNYNANFNGGNSELTIRGLEITDSRTLGAYASSWYWNNITVGAERVIIDNCTFSTVGLIMGATGEVKNCTFSVNIPSRYNLWVTADDVTVSGNTFSGTRGVKIHNDDAAVISTVTVTENEFNGLTEKPALNLADNATVTMTDNTFTNMAKGLYAIENGGTVVGNDTAKAMAIVTDSGETTYYVSAADAAADAGSAAVETLVAAIGDQRYATLGAALEAVTSNGTIEILSEIDATALTVALPNGVTNVTIQGTGSTPVLIKNLKATAPANDGLIFKNLEFSQTTQTLKMQGKNIRFENCLFNAKTVSYAGAPSTGMKQGNYTDITTIKNAENFTFKNCVFTGKGSDYDLPNARLISSPICKNLTVEGCTFTNAFSAIYYGVISGTFTIKNSTFEVYAYTTHMGGDAACSLVAEDTRFSGWTSYASKNSADTATFTNCEFYQKNGYDCIAAYLDTTFTNCTFDASFDCYAQIKGFDWTFTGCTKNGVKMARIGEEPVAQAMTRFGGFTDDWVWNECTCTITDVILVSGTGTESGGSPISATDAAAQVANTLDNSAVSDFTDTNIETATNAGTDAIKTALKAATDDDTSKDNIDAASDLSKSITVVLTAAKVENVTDSEETTQIAVISMTFDVKPVATVKVTDSDGQTKTIETVIPNSAITEPITFRLPVNDDITATAVAVYHSESDGIKGDFIGTYEIKIENGKKYIELSTSSFSYYTYEVMTGVTSTNKFAVTDGTTYKGFDTLADALAEIGNTTDKTLVLLADFANGDFSNKTLTFDLNGYKLTGTSANASNVTISSSDVANKATLAAIGTYANDASGYLAEGYITKRNGSESSYTYTVMAKNNLTSGVYMDDPTGATAANHYVTDNNDHTWTVYYVAPYVPVTTYPVTAPAAESGTVTVTPSNASKNTTVTITVTPDAGYELTGLTVTDASGNLVPLTQVSETKFTFTMPASQVTVNATFAEIDDSCDGGAACPAHHYTDVNTNLWYHEAIDYVVENGIMNGVSDNDFAPNGNLSRAMLMTMLARLDGTDTDGGTTWYEKGMNWAVQSGVSDGTNPGNNISRQEVATMLYRYVQLKGWDTTKSADLSMFADGDQTASWAKEAMEWAVSNGIFQGDNNRLLNPKGSATRAEVAQIIMNFCENVAK